VSEPAGEPQKPTGKQTAAQKPAGKQQPAAAKPSGNQPPAKNQPTKRGPKQYVAKQPDDQSETPVETPRQPETPPQTPVETPRDQPQSENFAIVQTAHVPVELAPQIPTTEPAPSEFSNEPASEKNMPTAKTSWNCVGCGAVLTPQNASKTQIQKKDAGRCNNCVPKQSTPTQPQSSKAPPKGKPTSPQTAKPKGSPQPPKK
jgi:DNA-directed RNA polymerase subunit RPC12/RpoP